MCLCLSECVCLVLVPAGVLCLCRADRTMPIGPISLKTRTPPTHSYGHTTPPATLWCPSIPVHTGLGGSYLSMRRSRPIILRQHLCSRILTLI